MGGAGGNGLRRVGSRHKFQVFTFRNRICGNESAAKDILKNHDSPAVLLHVPIRCWVACQFNCDQFDEAWFAVEKDMVALSDFLA